MKFENTQVFNFEGAFRGMRNPKNSWDRSDSEKIYWDGQWNTDDEKVKSYFTDYGVNFLLGGNDLKLAQALIAGGTEHRKFMRQIFVSVDITAPLYYWKEFSTYKVGTVANSTSTMHKLTSKPITLDCFEIDDYDEKLEWVGASQGNMACMYDGEKSILRLIDMLEGLRLKYLDTKDKRYWKELVRWIPESWLQTRTVTMNYENLRSMYYQRKNHKLNEWSGLDKPENVNFIKWVKSLPYAEELIMYEER